MPFSVTVFGPFAIDVQGQTLPLPVATARALLAFLAVECDRPHRREILAAMFWPDQARATAYANLRQTLSRARKALAGHLDLGDLVAITPQTLQWQASPAVVDAIRFEQLLAETTTHPHANPLTCALCATRLQQAAALYRGELLHGLFLEQSLPFEEWLLAKREYMHIQALDALHTLALHDEATGQYEQMHQHALRQIALEPWREGAHRQLMRALALSGERAAALAAYETCRRVLEHELGIQPSEETTALYRKIVAGEVQAPAPVPAARRAVMAAPEPPTALLGREHEVAAIAARLGDPACRLVTLTGPGGVGKTHLSLAAAHECAALFGDGVAFVSLAAISDPELVYPTIASVLGIHQVPDQSLFASLVAALREKQLLLLLDNFEQITAAGPHIGRLLAHTSQLKVLVTSRAALRLRAEFELAVEPLALPPVAGTASMVAGYPAIALFVQRAQASVPAFRLTDTNARLVVDICVRVDGLPLAIELAAARIKVLSLHQLLQRLSRRLDLLSAGKQDLPPRHQALRTTIEWSYNLLAAEHQQLFARLAVFIGGCTLEAAEDICGGMPDVLINILDGLQRLVDISLVRYLSGDDGTRRFAMLETIREYGLERLSALAEIEVLRERHAAYFTAFAEQAAPELAGGPAQAEWFAWVGADLDNIRAALRWAIERSDALTALRIGVALREFWMTRAYLAEGRQWLETALAQADRSAIAVADELRCKALTTAGWLAANSRDYAAAEQLFERSLAWAHHTEQPAYIMGALGDLAQAARMQHDLARATRLYQEALAIGREIGDQRGLAWMLCNLGMVAHAEMDDARAASLLEEGARVAQHLGDMICVGWCLTFLARIEKDRGNQRRSAAMFADVLAIFHHVGHSDGIAFTLEGRAGLAVRQGDLLSAARMLGAAEALREAINRRQLLYQRDFDPAAIDTASPAWRAAWAAGRTLSTEQAIALAGT